MAVDFFLNLLLGDVVKVRHDGSLAWQGLVCSYVGREATFLIDSIVSGEFKKRDLETTDEKLVRWRVQIEG
jgi:hypothetical protein